MKLKTMTYLAVRLFTFSFDLSFNCFLFLVHWILMEMLRIRLKNKGKSCVENTLIKKDGCVSHDARKFPKHSFSIVYILKGTFQSASFPQIHFPNTIFDREFSKVYSIHRRRFSLRLRYTSHVCIFRLLNGTWSNKFCADNAKYVEYYVRIWDSITCNYGNDWNFIVSRK